MNRPDLPPAGGSLDDWRGRVRDARRHGEVLRVIDLARQGLQHHPGDLQLEYDKALAQARAGATDEADANLRALQDAGALDAIADPTLRVDFMALAARLLKDRAYAAEGPAAVQLALAAAAAYAAVHAATGASFPAINAATLYAIGGHMAQARALAATALQGAPSDATGFWQGATIAEAHLLLGDVPAAQAALAAAVASGVHLDELATTRRQLAWLCSHLAIGPDTLAAIPAPYLLCWTTAPCDAGLAGSTTPVRALVAAHSQAGLPVLAYGAIISPADVAVAECLSDAGAHTNLVVASMSAACVAAFGARFGADWACRLQAVLAGARHVAEVTLEGSSAEATVAAMAAQQAHGLAAMRAAALVTRLHRVSFGTDRPPPGPPPPTRPQDRIARAFVFGDIKGFSTISEAEHRPFLDYIIGGFADVLDRLGVPVEYTETAGDGLFVVLPDVVSALRCCHGLQQVTQPAGLAAAGLPPTLGLRLGAHVGPAARGLDRVTGRQKFIGKEVIRTARIEAVTPVGQTYVTEQFAATLHALSPVGHACEYVGLQAMAKGFGYCRMYSLRPTPQILALLRG